MESKHSQLHIIPNSTSENSHKLYLFTISKTLKLWAPLEIDKQIWGDNSISEQQES
jgi:hypothetical protein